MSNLFILLKGTIYGYAIVYFLLSSSVDNVVAFILHERKCIETADSSHSHKTLKLSMCVCALVNSICVYPMPVGEITRFFSFVDFCCWIFATVKFLLIVSKRMMWRECAQRNVFY